MLKIREKENRSVAALQSKGRIYSTGEEKQKEIISFRKKGTCIEISSVALTRGSYSYL